MAHRVILVVESPFSRRDAERFGVADLRTAGLEVEVWDVCDLTLPDARRQWHEEAGDVPIERVTTWGRLDALAFGLSRDDAVVLICGTYSPLRERYGGLLGPVLASPAIVGALASGSIPPPSGRQRLVADAYRRYAGLRERARPEVAIPRSLDFVWAGTTAAAVARPLIGPRTVVRYIHALDYDRIIDLEPATPRSDFALLLDTMGPLHPDYVSLGMQNPWAQGAYEALVAEVFRTCDLAGQEIVVAAHPRAPVGTLDELYPGREIVHRDTARLLGACHFVICVEGSTSLGLAAVQKTPVLFVDDARIPSFVQAVARRFQLALKAPYRAAETICQEPLPPLVNEQAYAEYVRRYVKRPGTPSIRFWAEVAEDLMSVWRTSFR